MKVQVWVLPVKKRSGETEVIICTENQYVHEVYCQQFNLTSFHIWTERDGTLADWFEDEDGYIDWYEVSKEVAEWQESTLGVARRLEVEIEL